MGASSFGNRTSLIRNRTTNDLDLKSKTDALLADALVPITASGILMLGFACALVALWVH
jgi:hypothetical protein